MNHTWAAIYRYRHRRDAIYRVSIYRVSASYRVSIYRVPTENPRVIHLDAINRVSTEINLWLIGIERTYPLDESNRLLDWENPTFNG